MRRRISLKHTESDGPVDHSLRQNPDDEINLFEFGTTLVRKRRFIVYPVLAVMFITAVVLLFTPNRYTSTVTILPSGKTDKLSSLKSLAGFNSLTQADENSSELFPEILQSRLVKDAVLSRTYSFDHDGEEMTTTLEEYFDEADPDLLQRELGEIATFSIDKKTGVIRLAVETKYPAFSQAILSAYVTELENFNLHKRRSTARDNEIYLAGQMESKKLELAEAERLLEQFRMENRNWSSTSSPEILHELTRLQREAEIKSTAYLYLTRQHEMAKFEAQKDVPIVRLLDSPSLPTQKSSPRRTIILMLMGMITAMMATLAVVINDSIGKRSRSTGDDSYRTFRDNVTTAFPKTSRLVNRLKLSEKEPV
ncbi:MAG: hypothetical protein JSV52_09250 [Candidatus Zixiibacteriota bacterium]|nr:MAG: hypothetical protein JSV52_09250 [candidate division Zixibacteria bacterium]